MIKIFLTIIIILITNINGNGMVCRWMAEVTRVRRPKPQNDPGVYTLASWSQCAYQDNCANIMSATCKCGMSFVLHFALCTWASETSIVDGKTPMLILSRRRLECQRSIFHCPSSKAGHWIVPLLVKAWIVLPGQNFYWGLLSALGAGRSMLKSWTEPAVEPSVAVRRTTARVLSINTHWINVPGWPTIRWVWEVILGEGKYVWEQGLAGSRITTLTHLPCCWDLSTSFWMVE